MGFKNKIHESTGKNKIKFCFILMISILFLVWLVPFAHNEILTICYGDEFKDKYREWSYFANDTKAESFKILSYTDNNAKVYYVTQNHDSGQVYYFVKNSDQQWGLDKVNTIWAKGGSASEILWPYFWHVIYSGGT